MARAISSIDLEDEPDFPRVIEEVRVTGEARLLRRNGAALAMIVPVEPVGTFHWRHKSTADYEAFQSVAGSWKAVDTDRMLDDIYADREIDDRPSSDL